LNPLRLSYLDYNASTPLLPEAAAAMSESFALYGNPSSVHGAGRSARAAVEDAREAVAALVKVSPPQVIFTSGATEANALALSGAHVVASAVEHPSVLAWSARTVGVEARGTVDLAALREALVSPAEVVALMLANNETGVIQPVREARALMRETGARFHCDAVQGAGKLALDFGAIGADTMSLSAHKMGGPKGVGALIVREGLELPAVIRGGGQERRRRAGTENVTGIVGFGAAAKAAGKLLAAQPRIAALRDSLEAGIRDVAPSARILGADAPRLANTTCVALPGVGAEIQVMRLDLAGVAVSAGAACSSGKIAASHVITAMGASPADARCAIRISLGWETTAADIARFLEAWRPLARAREGAPIL
jgi:cysteine desulfurase